MMMTPAIQVPAMLPVLPGAAVSGCYVFNEEPPSTRGDILDALAMPRRQVALFVVDVVGSGTVAEVAVGQVRGILRERLGAGVGLMAALESLDRYAYTQPELAAATVCIATLGLDDGVFEWATAGHPPPLWLGAAVGVPSFLRSSPTRPLGTGGHRVTHTARLEPGDMVGLYTDGLITFDGRSLAIGKSRLLEAVRLAQAATPVMDSAAQRGDDVCDRVLRAMIPTQRHSDDAALLIVTRTALPEPFALSTEAVPENLPLVRHQINRWLDGLGAGLIDHIGLGHAVVELAANVIEHAYGDAPGTRTHQRIDVRARLDEDGIVRLEVSDTGAWRPAEARGDGRGLMMAAGLAETLRMVRSVQGTRVELTQRLTRPVPMLRAVASSHVGIVIDETEELATWLEGGRLMVTGSVDPLSVESFHAALTQATRAGTRDTAVDLDGITHLGSPGVQTIFEFVARAALTGVQLALWATPESPAAQVLELVGLPVRS